MVKTPTRAPRADPYRNFKFRILWEGRPVAGVSRVSGLAWEAPVLEMRDGADPNRVRRLPGPRRFEPVTLERGITRDIEFEQWAGADPSTTGRREVQLHLLNRRGGVVRAWRLHGCWVSRYAALAELEAGANAVAIESLTLQLDGWERETA